MNSKKTRFILHSWISAYVKIQFCWFLCCVCSAGRVSAEEDQQRDAGGADLRGAGGVPVAGRCAEGRPERLELLGRGELSRRESRSGRREHQCSRGEGLQGDGGERAEGGAFISNSLTPSDVRQVSMWPVCVCFRAICGRRVIFAGTGQSAGSAWSLAHSRTSSARTAKIVRASSRWTRTAAWRYDYTVMCLHPTLSVYNTACDCDWQVLSDRDGKRCMFCVKTLNKTFEISAPDSRQRQEWITGPHSINITAEMIKRKSCQKCYGMMYGVLKMFRYFC